MARDGHELKLVLHTLAECNLLYLTGGGAEPNSELRGRGWSDTNGTAETA